MVSALIQRLSLFALYTNITWWEIYKSRIYDKEITKYNILHILKKTIYIYIYFFFFSSIYIYIYICICSRNVNVSVISTDDQNKINPQDSNYKNKIPCNKFAYKSWKYWPKKKKKRVENIQIKSILRIRWTYVYGRGVTCTGLNYRS